MSDNADKNKFITRNAIDLLEKMLRFDPNERLTAKEATQHPYFKKVRDKIAKQNQLVSHEISDLISDNLLDNNLGNEKEQNNT